MSLSRSTTRALLLLAVAVVAAFGWLALVASHDDQGLFGQGAAAWAQAIMSVGAIIAAIVIDQGSSRRDREERREIAGQAKAARIGLMLGCKQMLDTLERAVRDRKPAPGLVFEGMGLDALKAGRSAIQHFIARGSDDDAALVWMLCRAGDVIDTAVADLFGQPLETKEQQATLAARARKHAQELLELTDEYAGGLYENQHLMREGASSRG